MRTTGAANGGPRSGKGWIRWLACCLFAWSAAAASAGTYRIVPLSADPAVSVLAVNARGQVAFTAYGDDGVPRARLYDGHRVRDLGTLGGPGATVAGLNDLGQVTGGASLTPDGSVVHAYLWSAGSGMVDLGKRLPGNSTGAAINDKGQVAGTASTAAAGPCGFVWGPHTGVLDIGPAGTYPYAYVTAMNDAGVVIGYGGNGPSDVLAFRWTRTAGGSDLGTLPGEFTIANDINRAGHVVGASGFPRAPLAHAFLWTPQDGLLNLSTSKGSRSNATRINDHDMVIGQSFDSPATFHGFVWTRATGTIDLAADAAADLNNLGQVVGAAAGHAVLWTRAQGLVDLNTRVAGAPPGLVLDAGLAISDQGLIVANSNAGMVLLVPAGAAAQGALAGPIEVTGAARTDAVLSFAAAFTDADPANVHRARWDWGDGTAEAASVGESRGAGSASGQHVFRAPGIYTVRLRVTDRAGTVAGAQRKAVVAGPGTVADGAGRLLSPPGAITRYPQRQGAASFAFLSGPGQASVEFATAGLDFRSSRADTLPAGAGRVRIQGSGTLGGVAGYRFLLSASGAGGQGRGRLRLRIWHLQPGSHSDTVDYDNQPGQAAAGDADTDEGAPIQSGTLTLPSS